jgi:lysophospholipase L1-like esterase
MRARLTAFFLLLLVTLCAAGRASAEIAPPYYLALGDSLSVGLQPTLHGPVPTNQGYADDLHAFYRFRIPGLRLAKLGCPGETTTTMLAGGVCSYPTGSQIAEAVAFLHTHRVVLITVDIGANNLLPCIGSSGIDAACVGSGINGVAADLPQILIALRAAAGPSVPIVGMNYYDPFLAAWRLFPAPAGPALAVASLQVITLFNSTLGAIYNAFRVPVAQVAAAFHINDFSHGVLASLPVNVELTLAWTWMGLPPPLGPNIHPNAVGYAVIAGAFVKAIGFH